MNSFCAQHNDILLLMIRDEENSWVCLPRALTFESKRAKLTVLLGSMHNKRSSIRLLAWEKLGITSRIMSRFLTVKKDVFLKSLIRFSNSNGRSKFTAIGTACSKTQQIVQPPVPFKQDKNSYLIWNILYILD